MKGLLQNHSFLIRLAVLALLSVSLPHWWHTAGVVWDLVPHHYVVVCCYLLLFLELGLWLLRRRHYVLYIVFLVAAYVAFYYLSDVLALLHLSDAYESLFRIQRLRVNYTCFTMLRVVMVASIVYHLFGLRRERETMQKAKMQAELTMLKSQITPHFFFNSLNSIYSLALAQSEKTPDAIITLSDMMRYVLTEAKADWIGLEHELSYLQHYVELQQLRLPAKTKLDYQVEQQLGDYRIPPMLLVSFYENAFKYGVSAQREVTISIHLTVEDHILRLRTQNALATTPKQEQSTGHGLANSRQRLELIYPNRHELVIKQGDDFFELELTLQLS